MRTVALPLFVTREVGASPAQLGLLTGVTTAAAVAVELCLGRFFGRTRKGHLLVAGTALWLAVAFAIAAQLRAFWPILVLGALAFSCAGLPVGQLLAIGGSRLRGSGARRGRMQFSSLRAVVSLGFALGPLAISRVIDSSGGAASILVVGICWAAAGLAAVLAAGGQDQPAAPLARPEKSPERMWPMATGLTLVLAVDGVRAAFLAVFADQQLHASANEIALLFTVSSALNLLFMPLCGGAADRFGTRPVVLGCSLFGVAAALGTFAATNVWQLLPIQVMHAVYTGGVLSIGLAMMQERRPADSSSASALFNVCFYLSSAAASLLGGALAHHAGLAAPFAGAGIAAAAGVAVMTVATSNRPVVVASPASDPVALGRRFMS
jgi:MFS transporter, SET family, sugar efflux transporter